MLQVETGVTSETDRHEIEEVSLLVPGRTNIFFVLSSPAILLRYGLTKRIELRLGAEFISETFTQKFDRQTIFTSNHHTVYGWSPIDVGAKFEIMTEKKWIPQTALLVNFAIPYGDYSFQTDYVSPGFRFAFQHRLSERFAFSYNLGYEWELNKNLTVGTGIYTAALGISLLDNLSAFAESYGFLTTGETPDHRLDGGFTYLITKNVQADISGGVGITDRSPDFFIGGGVSFRLPN
jgi:hypothetical protein